LLPTSTVTPSLQPCSPSSIIIRLG
jgi:hypothetical protein